MEPPHRDRMRPGALLLPFALGVSAAFAGAAFAAAVARPASMDAVALYAGARLVATGHAASLVDQDAVLAVEREAVAERTALLPFVQPPAVALILAPFGLLPFPIAYPLMSALAWLAAAAAAALVLPPMTRRAQLFAFALIAPATALAVAHAQTSPLVLLFVAVATRSGPRAGGLALGATLIRPQVAPLLLLAGVLDPARRTWTVLGALAVVLVSLALVGVDGSLRYLGLIRDAAAWSVTGEVGLRSSIGWAGPAIALGVGEAGIVAAAVSLLAGAVVVIRAPGPLRPMLASAWSLLASPHLLLHDAVLALPALGTMRRPALWAAVLALGWTAHATLVPAGVLVSLALALAVAREARAVRSAGP